MAGPSVLMHVGAWSQLLPPLAVLAARSRDPAHLWIAAGCTTGALADVVGRSLGARGINNHLVGYVATALITAGFLMALSHRQVSALERLTVRLAVPIFLGVWVVLVLNLENMAGFSQYAAPLARLVVLVTALGTLFRNGLAFAADGLLRRDWFWIAGGLAMYAAAGATFPPVAAALMPDRPDLVIRALDMVAVLTLLSFASIAWGVLCQRQAMRSGPSSLSPPSG